MARKKAVGSRRKRAARGLTFNHAMIYTRDVARAVGFYSGLLGFKVIDQMPPAYARLRSPRGTSTIALHLAGPDNPPDAPGTRLYFETPDVVALCRRLADQGVVFKQMPAKQPWGWTHAYLDDPDGHEISLYWAGAMRLAAPRRTGRADTETQRKRTRATKSTS
jgi:catechol 2,3-dioxygenase-like lactoylglutathione lyase family enzyme